MLDDLPIRLSPFRSHSIPILLNYILIFNKHSYECQILKTHSGCFALTCHFKKNQMREIFEFENMFKQYV